MIKLDRSRIPDPAVLKPESLAEELKRLREFYVDRTPSDRAQDRFSFTPVWNEVRAELTELSYGKCAFCEAPLTRQNLTVGHLRPKANAINVDGTVSADHYWWLAYEWANLYPVCESCNRMKGSRFPVNKPRAEADARGGALLAEEPLLLDPCYDEPGQYLVFDRTGLVASTMQRGQVTIDVFGLNQEHLRQSRQHEYEALSRQLGMLAALLQTGNEPPSLGPLLDPSKPYAGMRRQVVAQWLQTLPADMRERLAKPQAPEVGEAVAKSVKAAPSPEESQQTVQRYHDYRKATYSVASKDVEDKERYYKSFRPIERIEVYNFKGIGELKINLRGGDETRVPWLALIGENGTGKSSILQAVALALAGDEYRRELAIRPEDVLRFRCKSGSVKVFLAGAQEPIQLHFRRESSDFEASPSEPQVLFAGYGATRQLPRAGHEPKEGKAYARIDNLFDPFVPLQDAEQWLLALEPPETFDKAARIVKDLLSMEEENRIVRWQGGKHPRVEARIFGDSVPLDHLSDGYQSVLALATDIMAVMRERWKAAWEVAEGIVLVDELEAHIHPRWKQRITQSLRQAFPRIQFLFATHEPLCIQNCLKGEVHILSRDRESHAIKIEQADIPPGMGAEQILTSGWFGLSTAIDESTFKLLDDHRKLLLAPSSEPAQARIRELEAELRTRMGYGETAIERLAISAAVELMPEKPLDLDPPEREALRQAILERIKIKRGE